MTVTWHADHDTLLAFRDGSIDPVLASSIEAHLLGCERCRVGLAVLSNANDQARRDMIWGRITNEIDQPTHRFSSDRTWARITMGSPALITASIVIMAALAAAPLAVANASPRAGVTIFLALAPIMPLLGAVLAFRTSIDPAGRLAEATPLATMRLVVVRALVVVCAALPVGLAVAVALPVRTTLLLGWIAPGIALCLTVLATGTRIDPLRLASGLAVGWIVVVGSFATRLRGDGLVRALSDWVVNRQVTQGGFAVLGLLALIHLVNSRDAVVVHWSES